VLIDLQIVLATSILRPYVVTKEVSFRLGVFSKFPSFSLFNPLHTIDKVFGTFKFLFHYLWQVIIVFFFSFVYTFVLLDIMSFLDVGSFFLFLPSSLVFFNITNILREIFNIKKTF
jgi:hypothetical protein